MKKPVPKETGCRSVAVEFRGAPGWALGEEAMPWAVPEYVPTSVTDRVHKHERRAGTWVLLTES